MHDVESDQPRHQDSKIQLSHDCLERSHRYFKAGGGPEIFRSG